MLHNYHTHTFRCNHASGADREYVETALQSGMKTLGFSDHAPYLFPFKDYYSCYRMKVEEIEEYAESVRALAKEYEKDIRILCGFELEYYPDFHKEEMAFLNTVKPDYLILGQHFIGDERCNYGGKRLKDDFALVAYVSHALAGLATGDFLYLAHPDLAGTHFTPEVVAQEYRRLCEGAKRMHIPLEINFLGLREQRHYPSEVFLKIASEVGNDVIFGADAHEPENVFDEKTEEKAKKIVQELGLHLIEDAIL